MKRKTNCFCFLLIQVIDSNKSEIDRETNSVDYSTIERDYSSSRENTLGKGSENNDKRPLSYTRHGEQSGGGGGGRASEISTKNMRGPSTYKSSDLLPSDFPNIDIGPNDYSIGAGLASSMGGGRPSYSAGNRAYQNQLDAPYLGSNSNINNASSIRAAPQPPAKAPTTTSNKVVNFPSKNNHQQQQQQQQQFNMDKGNNNNSQRYVSNENVHLHQIIQESGFIADNIDRNL